MRCSEQSKIWKELTSKIDIEDSIHNAKNPSEFQIELKALLDSYCQDNLKIIEVGSFTGITSLILDDRFDKTLFDLNPEVVKHSKEVFRFFGKEAAFYVGDMFRMPFLGKTFDIVFNAGVIEHFDARQRVNAIREYGRILKNDGVMIIAFPNHFSSPYRLVYRYLTWRSKWPFPCELPLFDLRQELEEAGLSLQRREVMAKATALNYLQNLPNPLRCISRALFSWLPHEGYLTVVVARRLFK